MSTTTEKINYDDCPPMDGTPTSSHLDDSLVRLESVMQDIFRVMDPNSGEAFSHDDALESAAAAAEHLTGYKFYETAVCLQSIDDYKVELPDYNKIKAVYYRPELDNKVHEDMVKTTTVDLCEEPSSQLTYKNVYDLKRAAVNYNWTVMYPGHTIAAMARQLTGDAAISDGGSGMGPACPPTYSVRGCTMTTSECTGIVMVFYRRTLRDTDGHPLIPKVPMVNEAIRTYVLMEMQLKSMNSHREGSVSLYDRYFNLWEKQQAIARSEMVMPSLPEWVSMAHHSNRMLKNDPYERLFDNHYGSESINFGNY